MALTDEEQTELLTKVCESRGLDRGPTAPGTSSTERIARVDAIAVIVNDVAAMLTE